MNAKFMWSNEIPTSSGILLTYILKLQHNIVTILVWVIFCSLSFLVDDYGFIVILFLDD